LVVKVPISSGALKTPLHVPNTCMAPVQKKTADFTGHIPENESLFAMPTAYRTKLTVPEVYRSRGS
jgi:hypothetical protein